MGMISKLLSGTAILIGMYLILDNAKESVSVVNALSSTYNGAVRTLQGRD